MEVADSQSVIELGSSSPVSSPPQSPGEVYNGYDAPLANDPSLKSNSVTGNAAGSNGAVPAPKKTRAPRKKKDDASNNAPDGEAKPPKKPRKPRDPNAPPRKRQKKSEEAPTTDPQQSKLGFGAAPPSHALDYTQPKQENRPSPAPPAFARLGNNEAEQKPNVAAAHYGAAPHPPPRPQSSGQRYDPIRSASAENARLANPNSPSHRPVTNHVRASPSIASLIGPSQPINPSSQITSAPRVSDADVTKAPSPSNAVSATSSQQTLGASTDSVNSAVAADATSREAAFKPAVNGASATPSRGSSPKPARKKKEMPQLPPGNGLLSGSDFGKPDSSEKVFAEVPNQCIVIDVPIKGQANNYVNFIREVEQKYGFDVAHPRLAEHRRRMAQMAAAGAALESGAVSADDMALDGSDVESNAELGGADDDSSAGDGTKKKRARRGDEYDKNDDFIDDTEQAWEEQALASRDGYFVWSGPLVPEGDKPAVERADGTVKRGRGGRGRGGASRGEGSGRGSRGGGTRRGTGGTGRGSRGGGTAGAMRKSRLTKAEKEEMEHEKVDRQKLAASLSKPAVPQGIIGV